MNRRDTLTALLAFGAVAAPPAVRGQPGPSAQNRTLGVLTAASAQDAERLWLGLLRTELKTRGWVAQQNLVIAGAFADYNAERLPALAEDLLRKRAEVIWAYGGEAAVAAARATRTIPIVFVAVPYPVETGLIDSFARPGRNVTGVSTSTGIEVSTKRLELLKEIAPTATRLSWILDAGMAETVDGGRVDFRPMLDPAARTLGYEVRYHLIAKREDLDAAFADILRSRAEVLAVAGGAATFAARDRIADFALRNRLPTSCAASSLVDAGGLFSYNAVGRSTVSVTRGAEYVDRVFRGARPADLPVSRPEKYELVINLKSAKALGLRIPQSVRLRADRVID